MMKRLLFILAILALLAPCAMAALAGNATLFYVNLTSNSPAQVDYVLPMVVNKTTGVSGNGVLYTGGTTNSTLSDILFVDYATGTPLNHWIENNTQTATSSNVWVRIPSFNSTTNTSILFYYGNSSMNNQRSNGTSTFPLLFDDFLDPTVSAARWDTTGMSTVTVTSGNVYTAANAGYGNLKSKTLFTPPIATVGMSKYTSGLSNPAVWQFGIGTNSTALSNYAVGYFDNSATRLIMNGKGGGTAFSRSTVFAFDTYKKVEVGIAGVNNTVMYRINGTESYLVSTANSVPNNTPMAVGLLQYLSTANTDWFAVRNYTEPEATTSKYSQFSANPPFATYTISPEPGIVGSPVTFTDASTNTPTSWDWGFGDGTANSTLQNPTHTYSSAGTYRIYLEATNAFGSNTTHSKYLSIVNISGFNQQDITMDPVFTFTIHITDKSTGAPILVATVTDASTGGVYSTTNGTVFVDTPYGTLAGWIQAPGYDPVSFSKVIDEDTSETYQLAKAVTSNSSQVQYSSAHNVKILVKDAWIGPIEGVNVTATYVEASGPFDWLFAWIGVISGSGANVQNTTLYGHTGTDGAINFLMVESVQYNITAVKPGVVSKSILIYPKDDDYTIWTQEMNSSFLYESGYNELEEVQIAVNGTEVNQTYGKIMVTYYDHLDKTNFVFITVNQSVVSGNSTVEHSVSSTTVTGDSDFTSTLYIANSRDQSYLVHVLPNHTVFGNISRDFGVTFPPGPISLGLPENLLHIIGMGMLFFIVLLFVRTLPGETVIVVTFFAWVFFFMRWWTQMAPYYIVLGALVGMTVFAIVYNIVLRSKKVILS